MLIDRRLIHVVKLESLRRTGCLKGKVTGYRALHLKVIGSNQIQFGSMKAVTV